MVLIQGFAKHQSCVWLRCMLSLILFYKNSDFISDLQERRRKMTYFYYKLTELLSFIKS